MKLKKKNKMKTVELILYWIILVLFLFANLYYFRGFHKIPFIMAGIVCLIKTIRYIVVKKWKKRHILHAIVSGFFVYAMLLFTCEMDIYFFPSTELRHYEEAINQYNITEKYRYGIFPEVIPKEATDIEFYYTTEGFWTAPSNMRAYLKMTVNDNYLNNLLEKYEDNITFKLECSIINKENAHEYLPTNYLDEHTREFYEKRNCTLYYMSNDEKGFIIDWEKKRVKLFLDNRF